MLFLRCSIVQITLLLITTLISPFIAQDTVHAEAFSISKPDIGMQTLDPELSWTIELVDSGIQNSLEVFFEKPAELSAPSGELAWEYRLEVDDMTVLHEFLTDSQKSAEQMIPLDRMNDGKHIAALTVRDFEGNLHTLQRKFELNSSPKISATSLDNKDEVFDPLITFSFLGAMDGFPGMAEIYLDEQPLQTVNIAEEQNNNPVRLSELTGSQIYSGDLTPGKHILTIKAYSITGSSSTHALSITGSLILPEIKERHSNDNTLENLEIHFPASSKKIVGSAEVHYNRSIILAVRTEQTSLLISRNDMIDALKKHNLKIGDPPVSMIISARSANQVENWQEVMFK